LKHLASFGRKKAFFSDTTPACKYGIFNLVPVIGKHFSVNF
jgi:hypothetical protein